MFCKKGVLINFAKFTGKHQCQSPYFDKVVGLRSSRCSSISLFRKLPKMNLQPQLFYRAPFFKNTLCDCFCNIKLFADIESTAVFNDVQFPVMIKQDNIKSWIRSPEIKPCATSFITNCSFSFFVLPWKFSVGPSHSAVNLIKKKINKKKTSYMKNLNNIF